VEIVTGLGKELALYLDLNTREIQLTAANMANVDTPGYRAVGMDFEAEMRQAMVQLESDSDSVGPSAVSAGPKNRSRPGFLEPKIFAVDGLIVRPDGNNVSMDRESLRLAQAQLRFKLGVALLKSQYADIMNAIHADSK
jgi:flagellar basal-body rod protein FlgB